ncbi:unnamed protein product [Clonostachys solani]|uniref:Uncharacterized protein n=1 Tax=Clonostachys solani TaxID=160281 RepID=A0A9P0ERE4_9HYPO|nr:unnamed protein product [Clonostachys solani]
MAILPPIMSGSLSRAPCILRSRLYTIARLAYRGRLTLPAAAPPPLSRALPPSRPISTAPPKALSMTSPSLERHKSSPERSIQRQIAAGNIDKWGWVVYRTAYQPELDAAWATLQRLVLESLRECVAESDAPEIADRVDWVFVADLELEGASLDELKRRFRACARVDAPCDLDTYEPGTSRGSRYDFFVQAEPMPLCSAALMAWVDQLPEEKAMDADGEPVDNEDWMKIQLGVVSPHYYVELGDDETWYAYYRPPPNGICMP